MTFLQPSTFSSPALEAASRAAVIQSELETYVDSAKQAFFPRFFKAGKGEYGEGDRFLGVVVPNVRRVAKAHKGEPLAVVNCLLQSPWHECRLCSLLMLVEHFKKATPEERKEIVYFYLDHTDRINNWDLVDLSAPYIIGEFINEALKNPRHYRKFNDTFYEYVKSPSIWKQRIAIVSTLPLIRQGDFGLIIFWMSFFIAEQGFYVRPGAKRATTPMHDLIQKALGWMLREVGKKDERALKSLLDIHAGRMPRTMLRYAIEKLSPEERKKYMKM